MHATRAHTLSSPGLCMQIGAMYALNISCIPMPTMFTHSQTFTQQAFGMAVCVCMVALVCMTWLHYEFISQHVLVPFNFYLVIYSFIYIFCLSLSQSNSITNIHKYNIDRHMVALRLSHALSEQRWLMHIIYRSLLYHGLPAHHQRRASVAVIAAAASIAHLCLIRHKVVALVGTNWWPTYPDEHRHAQRSTRSISCQNRPLHKQPANVSSATINIRLQTIQQCAIEACVRSHTHTQLA